MGETCFSYGRPVVLRDPFQVETMTHVIDPNTHIDRVASVLALVCGTLAAAAVLLF